MDEVGDEGEMSLKRASGSATGATDKSGEDDRARSGANGTSENADDGETTGNIIVTSVYFVSFISLVGFIGYFVTVPG